MLHHQRGASFYTTLLLVLLLIFTGLFAFRVGMPILDNWTVQKVLEGLKSDKEIASMSNSALIKSLEKKFEVNSISHLRAKDDVEIVVENGVRTVIVNYEARVPFFSNIDLVVKFDKNEVELPLQR